MLKKIFKSTSLIILLIAVLYLFYNLSIGTIAIYIKHYIGITLVAASTILIFISFRVWVYFFSIVLLLGTFNYITVMEPDESYYFAFSINSFSMKINIQLLFLSLFVFHLAVNFKEIKRIFKKPDNSDTSAPIT